MSATLHALEAMKQAGNSRVMTAVCVGRRPLPAQVAPLLHATLQLVLGRLCGAFPAAKACLLAAAIGEANAAGSAPGALAGNAAALAAITDEYDDDEDVDGARAG